MTDNGGGQIGAFPADRINQPIIRPTTKSIGGLGDFEKSTETMIFLLTQAVGIVR